MLVRLVSLFKYARHIQQNLHTYSVHYGVQHVTSCNCKLLMTCHHHIVLYQEDGNI